jgi:WD40 repeat protein
VDRLIGRWDAGAVARLSTVSLPGGVRLVSANDSGVRVWDLAGPATGVAGVELARSSVPYPGVNGVAVCQLDHEHAVIAVATEDGVSWWDPVAGTEPHPEAEVSTVWSVATAAGPDGRPRLFGAAHVQPWPVLCWDAATGRELPPVGYHDICVMAVAALALPDQLLVVSADEGGIVRCWDALTAGPLATRADGMLDGHESRVLALALAQLDGGRVLLASADLDGTINRWNPHTGEPLGTTNNAHEDGIYQLHLTRLTRPLQLISAGGDGVIRRWDAITGQLIDESLTGYSATSCIVDHQPILVVSDADGTINLYALTDRQ